MLENEEALLNQPLKAVCIKQAVILETFAFQAGCYEFEYCLPGYWIRKRSDLKRTSLKDLEKPFDCNLHTRQKASHMTVSCLVLARTSQVAWTPDKLTKNCQ